MLPPTIKAGLPGFALKIKKIEVTTPNKTKRP